jgi:hypothetical protein
MNMLENARDIRCWECGHPVHKIQDYRAFYALYVISSPLFAHVKMKVQPRLVLI